MIRSEAQTRRLMRLRSAGRPAPGNYTVMHSGKFRQRVSRQQRASKQLQDQVLAVIAIVCVIVAYFLAAVVTGY